MLLEVRFVEFFTRPKRPIKLSAGHHIFKLALVVGFAFAGFCELELHHHIRVSIDFNFQAFSQVTAIIHKLLLLIFYIG